MFKILSALKEFQGNLGLLSCILNPEKTVINEDKLALI